MEISILVIYKSNCLFINLRFFSMMCHFCFRNKKAKNERAKQFSMDSQFISSEITSSRIPTPDLTVIYEIPNKKFKTVNDVIVANGYELEEEIGRGNYAIVYKTRRLKDDSKLACKVLLIQAELANNNANLSAKNELFILQRLDHPHIVRMYQHFIVDIIPDKKRFVYIFMQLAEGKSLSIYMRNVSFGLPEATCKRIFSQLVSALNHIHQHGIAHCDLKMANVLLNNNLDCLISDFGLSRLAYMPSKGGIILSPQFYGTPQYMAPEILLAQEYHSEYNPFIADIWALGVILYIIINRSYPFEVNDKMLHAQMDHKIKFTKKITFQPNNDLIDLINKLLDPNVQTRIRMKQLLTHTWIEDQVGQIDKLITRTI